MALSKEWKERYLSEMAKAHQRMSEITKLHPDWHFEPPKTLPRNDYEAARRITDFKRINIKAFESGTASKYIVYWTDISIPTYKGEKHVTKGQVFTRRQVLAAEKARQREFVAWKELGLEGEPAEFTPGTQSGRKKYQERRRRDNVKENVLRGLDRLKANVLKSLNKHLAAYEDMLLDGLYEVTERIIAKMEQMSPVDIWNRIRPYMNPDGSNDLFQAELFGSGNPTLSESNLDKLAQVLGLSTYTEDVTAEDIAADEERRSSIREEMLKNPPF